MVINEEKLLIYLNTEVVGREKSGKRVGTVGMQTIRNVVSAVVALYSQQVTANANSNPSPRGRVVKLFLKYLRRKEFQRQRQILLILKYVRI